MRPPLLIVGQSGRALAVAAAPCWTPWVIDLFGDTDTRACAARWAPLAHSLEAPLEMAVLEAALDHCLAQADLPPPILLCSGFENAPPLVDLLASRGELLGAGAAVWRYLGNLPAVFERLAAMGVQVPPTQRVRPAETATWLCKRSGECGGCHVRAAPASGVLSARDYYQARVPGASVSALFIAGATRCRLLGYAASAPGARGLVALCLPGSRAPGAHPAPPGNDAANIGMSGHHARTARRVRARLRARCDGHPLLVDINPRFTATIELYPERTALIAAHVRACRNGLVDDLPPPVPPWRGHAVLYAPDNSRVPSAPRWPQGSGDLPQPNSTIAAGQPLLTVVAGGADGADVCARLALRARAVFAHLGHAVPDFEVSYLGGENDE